jgi:glycerol-3-phosphate dehydrogenase
MTGAAELRTEKWEKLNGKWDLIIIGGGITGAGIFREATRAGLKALLVEAQDFARGASSHSSKLVHGGFRYLRNGQIRLTLQSVRERERLVREGRGLVTQLGFLLASFEGDAIPGWVFGAGLTMYDLLARKWAHRAYDAYDLRELCPQLSGEKLRSGYRFFDAQTDDARLVLRLIQEAVCEGGMALNYASVSGLLKRKDGRVCGVVLQDQTPNNLGRILEIQAPVVINATGAWVDQIRQHIGAHARLRRLRGSHLVLPFPKLPLTRSVSFLHPEDGRPVFTLPWEGVTLVGTTDVDHTEALNGEVCASRSEAEYLMQAVQFAFPDQFLSLDDVQCTFAGIRPVIDTGKADPSKESREYVLWLENGLLTVAGGKLTTFRSMAHDALQRIRPDLPGSPSFDSRKRMLDEPPSSIHLHPSLSPASRLRLIGRHSANTQALMEAAHPGELSSIPGTNIPWAEVRWAARRENVVHLDDLFLRRVRLGLLAPQGGADFFDQLQLIIQSELGWDEPTWTHELSRYVQIWKACYHLPKS